MGLDQGQLEDSVTLRRKVTEKFRDFLLLVKAGLSGREKVPEFDHPSGAWKHLWLNPGKLEANSLFCLSFSGESLTPVLVTTTFRK